MFQIVTALNLACPEEIRETIEGIKLRGYAKETFLTGQFAGMIREKTIKSLSVSDISDFLCPSRRDLYYKKGKNKPRRVRRKKTWGGLAGHLVENFILENYERFSHEEKVTSYRETIEQIRDFCSSFKESSSGTLKQLDGLKSREQESPQWLLELLVQTGKMELVFQAIHKILSNNGAMIDISDVTTTSCELRPHPLQIGISRPVSPDFLLEEYGVVGDIKSGIGGFKDYYLLTCTGYGLAFENQKGKGNSMNLGVIYFFPTRCSEYARPISFAQAYIFVIDDSLREYFLRRRDEAYSIISSDTLPTFPDDKSHCYYCQFCEICKSDGLQI